MLEKDYTIQEMQALIKGVENQYETTKVNVNGQELEIKLRTTMTYPERLVFMETVIENCHRDNGYSREDFDWVFEMQYLNFMSNLPLIPLADNSKTGDISANYMLVKKINLAGEIQRYHWGDTLDAAKLYWDLKDECQCALDYKIKEHELTKMIPVVQAMNELGEMSRAIRELVETLLEGASAFFSDDIKEQFMETLMSKLQKKQGVNNIIDFANTDTEQKS